MSKMQKRAPEVRFKGFTDDWEQRELKSLVDRIKSYSLSRDIETSECTGYKYIHYGDIHKKVADIVDENSNLPNIKVGNYELLEKGDLILADASEDYEGIATPALINVDLPYKVVAGLHTIALRPKQVNPLFLYFMILSPRFRKYGYRVGTGMKVFGISVNNLLKFENGFPSLEEQGKIADFLIKIDKTIALHQRKIEKFKQLERAYLQALFPNEKEKSPKVRFANFEGDWEQRKASEIFKSISDKGHIELPILSASQEMGMVLRNEIGIDIKYNENSVNTYKRVLPGQFVIHLRSFQGGFAYSNIEGITSPAYTILDFKDKAQHNPLFWKVVLTSNNFIKRLETVTYGIRDGRSISYSDFSTLKFQVPHIVEQEKIGEFLIDIDDTIGFHQKKVKSLKQLKKLYLQKLFV